MKAPEVKALVDTLTARVDHYGQQLAELHADQKAHLQFLNDHKLSVEKTVVVIVRDVEDLKKGRDTHGHRLFTVVLALVSALVGGLISYYLRRP